MPKIQRKFIFIGILSILVIALVAVFAIPTIAAGPFPWGPGDGANKNMTSVQGTITAISSDSITIGGTVLGLNSSTNFTIHGNSWVGGGSLLNEPATASYDKTVTPPVASQVMINMPTPAPGTGKPQPNKNLGTVQGTLTVPAGIQ